MSTPKTFTKFHAADEDVTWHAPAKPPLLINDGTTVRLVQTLYDLQDYCAGLQIDLPFFMATDWADSLEPELAAEAKAAIAAGITR